MLPRRRAASLRTLIGRLLYGRRRAVGYSIDLNHPNADPVRSIRAGRRAARIIGRRGLVDLAPRRADPPT